MAERLMAAIHQQVHDLMSQGLVPTAVRVGWTQYGEFHRLLSDEMDAPRPRAVLGADRRAD